MAAKLDHMDDTYSQAMASRREVRRRSHDTAAWVGACVLGALTVAALVPPAFFRLAIASPHQYGLAGEPCQPRGGGLDSHADSPRPSWRCRLFRADNVAVAPAAIRGATREDDGGRSVPGEPHADHWRLGLDDQPCRVHVVVGQATLLSRRRGCEAEGRADAVLDEGSGQAARDLVCGLPAGAVSRHDEIG
jgi:hypothetical protein